MPNPTGTSSAGASVQPTTTTIAPQAHKILHESWWEYNPMNKGRIYSTIQHEIDLLDYVRQNPSEQEYFCMNKMVPMINTKYCKIRANVTAKIKELYLGKCASWQQLWGIHLCWCGILLCYFDCSCYMYNNTYEFVNTCMQKCNFAFRNACIANLVHVIMHIADWWQQKMSLLCYYKNMCVGMHACENTPTHYC